MKATINIKGKNITIEGTNSEVRDIIKNISEDGLLEGNRGFYQSESKGLIQISSMDTTHILNAVLKILRENLVMLRYLSNRELSINLYGAFDGTEYETEFNALLKELMERDDEMKISNR